MIQQQDARKLARRVKTITVYHAVLREFESIKNLINEPFQSFVDIETNFCGSSFDIPTFNKCADSSIKDICFITGDDITPISKQIAYAMGEIDYPISIEQSKQFCKFYKFNEVDTSIIVDASASNQQYQSWLNSENY